MARVTKRQAEAALNAVRRQFRSYLEPFDGYGPMCPEPTLNMDWDGHVAILWEDGPSEWAHRATVGGSSEEDRCLLAAANVEFGTSVAVREDEPITWPKGVEAEPYYSFVLVLFPENG